jgi:hypothetical protein
MKKNEYVVRFPDVSSFDIFSNHKEALAYARRGKDDHGGASVYVREASHEGTGPEECLASWTRGEDGKVRRVMP